MKGKEYDVDVKCPKCKAKLIIYDYTYYNEFSNDVELEWECPNDCEFDDVFCAIDEEVNRAVSGYIYGDEMNDFD